MERLGLCGQGQEKEREDLTQRVTKGKKKTERGEGKEGCGSGREKRRSR